LTSIFTSCYKQKFSLNVLASVLKDLARFLAVLAIFVFGFSMNMVSLNQPFQPPSKAGSKVDKPKVSATFSEGKFYKANLERVYSVM
jgi:hypothetical protein